MQFAQTHLQLLKQARAAGYGKSEIYDLRQDYETACRLHGHQARYSGRPFVCHLVGTASVVLAERKSHLLVRAALNHAAYDVGRFPSGARGVRDDHIRWFRSRVGEEVEALVRASNDYPVVPSAIMVRANSSLEGISELERQILELEVCNEVDDGFDYGASLEIGPKWHVEGYIDGIKALAAGLGLSKCENAFDQIASELADSDWLTPEKHFTFTANQPSPLRYIKGRAVAFLKRLRGQTEHY